MSYGIMNLMMTSTPLAMHAHDHSFHDSVLVIEWHVIGMYAPSFFTGSLINRYGVLRVILAGVLIYFVSAAAALEGTAVINFWLGMFLCGVGWNFMFVGASTLITECHTPAERAKTQAANDFMIFATMAISSTSSGVLLNKSGWYAVNWGAIPCLMLAGAATLWLMRRRAATMAASGGAPL
jgi:MFS family permease